MRSLKKPTNIIKTSIKKVGAELVTKLVRSRLSDSGDERHAKI